MLDTTPNQTSRQRLNQLMSEANNPDGENFKLGIILLSVFIAVLLIIFGVYLFRSKPAVILSNNSEQPKTTLVDRLIGNTNTNQKVTGNNQDTDKDGLSDADELNARTDLTKPDTDNDGLTDREEIMVYKTDPLKVDTDGDGINDGQEIKNRTNPLDAKANAPWPPLPNDLSTKK